MEALVEPQAMTGGAGRPKRSQRNDVSVKIDAKIVEEAKLVALLRRTTLAEYLSEILRGPVKKDYNKERKQLGEGEV